ncbi:HlyD family secretion protein [Sulfurimonas microaerophilic]|uniref:HlyD family secretion protein n=1 Tax=Sulfurimonas microaerophilic TaxID=3058392 RepID=UPI0027153F22|nr:hypothetical protein [Sulfurimonas sp. hsl 1-7]
MDKYQFNVVNKVELSPVVKKIWIFSFTIVLILFSMLFLPWQQTVKGKGSIIALDPTQRDYSILAPVDGFVEKFYVGENQFVKKGESLFKMVDLDTNYLHKLEQIEQNLEHQIENTTFEIKNLEKQHHQTQNYLEHGLEVYEEKVKQVQNKIKSLEFKKVSLEKNHEIEKANYERIKTLYNEGIESKRTFEKVENSYIKANAEFKKIDLDIEIEKKNMGILEKEKAKFLSQTTNKLHTIENTTLTVKSKLKNLNQQLSTQSIAIERYKNAEVIAQKDGYVVRVFKNDKNRYLKKGEEILHFSPSVTQKALRLKVSDFNMPLIKEGLPVRIMFYGWPALQISGWPKIQFGSFSGIVKKVEHISHEQGYYYAYVVEDPKEPWPKGDELRIGTQASAWVRLSTVPIWYQLWRLMNALPPQMVHPDREKY